MKNSINLLSFTGKYKILHLTWVALFMCFVIWMGLGPLMPFIQDALQLTDQQAKVLLLLNVGMAIPARIVVGMLVDKFGPRIMFSSILVLGGCISIAFSWVNDYESLALTRFLSGFVGAGFVVGIRMISEWFPEEQTGIAEGIYGGWGNFGSAAAAITLPFLANAFGGEQGWRYAITIASLIVVVYGVIYYINVADTPKGRKYLKPKKIGAMKVDNKKDFMLYILMNTPLYLAMAAIIWKLSHGEINIISASTELLLYGFLVSVFVYQAYKAFVINADIFKANKPIQQQYKFKQVAVLNVAYFISFGTELAVVSILAMFYVEWFEMSKVNAVLLAGIYPFLNLVARPAGGYLSDVIGRKKALMMSFSGLAVCFLMLGEVNSNWPIYAVVFLTIVGGVFSKAGSGAVFAMVPLIQRKMTGQIAGMVGAFGNVGGVLFLMANSFVSYDIMFFLIGCCSLFLVVAIIIFLEEPHENMAAMPDYENADLLAT